VQHIHQSHDLTLYQALLTTYEQMSNTLGMPLPNPLDLAQLVLKADAALDSAASTAASSSNNSGDLLMSTTAASAARKRALLEADR
jgi:hypothetical protein